MSASIRVLLTDRAWPDDRLERDILEQAGFEVVSADDHSEAALIELARDVHAIGVNWAPVTTAVIAAAPQCRVITRFGIGLDNIDVAEATRRKIPVTNVPDYCVSEVSDHTLALILAAVRNVGFFHTRTKQGVYNLAEGPPMRRLSELTLGIVGCGKIGKEVARKASAFGFRVQACSRSGKISDAGIAAVDLETLLQTSDVITLHLPLTSDTKHMINRETLARMKPGAILVNTSRGGLIDHEALAETLAANRLGGVTLDVFEPEPPHLDSPLFEHPRVILTPHAAFVSHESLQELRTRAARQIVTALQGGRPENIVNPEVLTP
ncbi:MAG: C-terminal binding protein [Planctomycetales bacterium]